MVGQVIKQCLMLAVASSYGRAYCLLPWMSWNHGCKSTPLYTTDLLGSSIHSRRRGTLLLMKNNSVVGEYVLGRRWQANGRLPQWSNHMFVPLLRQKRTICSSILGSLQGSYAPWWSICQPLRCSRWLRSSSNGIITMSSMEKHGGQSSVHWK